MNIKRISKGRSVKFDVYDNVENETIEGVVTSVLTEKFPPYRFVSEYVNQPADKFICFSDFYTKPFARKRGYGRKLIQDVKEYYKGYVVYLGVGCFGQGEMMNNNQLISFYQSEGFKVVPQPEDNPFTDYTIMFVEL